MTEELRSCKDCKHPWHMSIQCDGYNLEGKLKWFAICRNWPCNSQTENHDTPQEALQAWNKRA